MAEKAVAVVVTCVENPRNDVDGGKSAGVTHGTKPKAH
jgi:hypothetical protein